MTKTNKARGMLAVSMSVFGTIGIFVRFTEISSSLLALLRAVIAAVLLGLFLTLTKQKINFSAIKSEIPLLLISGIAMGFNWILLFEAYKYTTVSVATLSYYFAPIIVTLICPIIFKEKMTAKQWICFIMSTVGIVLITGIGDMSKNNKHLLGIAFGLSAACLYATVIILNKKIQKVSGIHRTFLQFVAAIAVLLPYVLLTEQKGFAGVNKLAVICILVIGIVHTGITYCLYFSSIKELRGQETAVLSYIDPLVAVLVSVLILKETITPVQIIGGVLILGFTLLNEIKKP